MVSESVLRGVYDSQLRTVAEVADMDAVERIGPLWLGTSAVRRAGFVTYESLPQGTDLEQLVDAAIRHFEPIKYVEKVSSGVPDGFSVCQATTDADVVEAVGSADDARHAH